MDFCRKKAVPKNAFAENFWTSAGYYQVMAEKYSSQAPRPRHGHGGRISSPRGQKHVRHIVAKNIWTSTR
jgi:hypothetical protein